MKTTLAELVSVILAHIESCGEKQTSEKAVRSLLVSKGYNRRDIESAIDYIFTRMDGASISQEETPAMRQLAFYETAKIQQDVHHAITRLELMGLIEPVEREMLIERFVHSEGQADMDALDYALSYIVGARRNVEAQQALLAIFEGYAPTVH